MTSPEPSHSASASAPPVSSGPSSSSLASAFSMFPAPAPPPVVTAQTIQASITKAHEVAEVFDTNIDSLAPWSNSKYKSLKKCPFQFYLKYILKVKVPESFQTQSDPVSANVGKAAHEILEHIMAGKPIDKCFEATKKNYVGLGKPLTEEQWVEKVECLYSNISNFKDRMDAFARRNPIKRTLMELRIGLTRKLEPTGFFADNVWLRGVIDLIIMLENGDALIIDHKTGGGLGGTKYYEEQLDWYKVMQHFGIQPARGVQTGIHFIQQGDVKMAKYSGADEVAGNLKNSLEMSLEGAVDMLKELGYFKHIRGPMCKWCEYDNIGCKDGTFKPMELSTKKWFAIKPVSAP